MIEDERSKKKFPHNQSTPDRVLKRAAHDDQLAAQAIEITRRNVQEIVENFVEGDPQNVGQQILTMWLNTDSSKIKTVAMVAARHKYFRERGISPDYAKNIISDVAEELYAQQLMRSGISEDSARTQARKFRKARHSLIHKKMAESSGPQHFSEKGRLQENAWPLERIKELMRLVTLPEYRWSEGKYKDKPNWNKIADALELTHKAVIDEYRLVRDGVLAKSTSTELIRYAEEVGLYTLDEKVDWLKLLPHVHQLLTSQPEDYIWQDGGNKGKPIWRKILVALHQQNVLPEQMDLDDPQQLAKYAGEMSNAFKRNG